MAGRRALVRPTGPIRLARAPWRRRLLAALDFSGGAPVDLTGNWRVAVRNGTPGSSIAYLGPHLSLNGSQSYSLTGSSAGFTGDLSVIAVAMRSNTPTTGLVSTTVQTVWTTNPQGSSVGAEMNMGNGFGSAGDITKPRAATNNVSATAAWLDGVKQAGTNPFTSAVANGVWAGIGSTHTGASGGGSDFIIGQTQGVNNFALTGGVACIWVFRGILGDAEMALLSREPWRVVEPVSAGPIFHIVTTLASTTTDATLSATLDSLTSSATATAGRTATLAATLGAVTSSATATAGRTASLTATLDAVAASATATAARTATLSATLADAALTSDATAGRTAALAVTLDALTLSASGDVGSASKSATLTVTLDSLAAASTATAGRVASLSATLGGVTLSSAVSGPVPANAAVLSATLAGVGLHSIAVAGDDEMSIREAALGAIATKLETELAMPVERGRRSPIGLDETLPRIVLMMGNHEEAEGDEAQTLLMRVEAMVEGYCTAANDEALESAINTLHARCSRALLGQEIPYADASTAIWVEGAGFTPDTALLASSAEEIGGFTWTIRFEVRHAYATGPFLTA